MTLSLDDVRNKRFRMARKSGYEVLEVDEFVDEVESAFEQLIDENANLKQQIASLSAAPSVGAEPSASEAASQPTAAEPERIVVTTGKEASSAVVRLVELSTEQAETLVAEATAEAQRIREEASTEASQVTGDAQGRADQIESEAKAHADQVQADATSRAESLNAEIDARRADLFAHLEQERDQLSSTVRRLRDFEAAYRSNLSGELHDQLATLENTSAEPADAPELSAPTAPASDTAPAAETPPAEDVETEGDDADRPTGTSDTPRLDALLGEQR